MLKRLSIQNFLSHKKTEMVFGPGINWVVGETDSGKSAVIRAIRWAWKNSPSGFAFRSRWAKKEKTIVVSEFSDGTFVERMRSTSENSYKLNNEPLLSFGTEPPSVVAEAINIDDTNIQRQGDQPFLLSMNPPEVARFLNSVANLTDIDEAHTRIAGKLRTCDADVLAETRRRDEAAQQLEKFTEIDNLLALAEQARAVETSVSAAKQERSTLLVLLEQHEKTSNQIKALRDLPNTAEISVQLHALRHSQREVDTLTPMIQQLHHAAFSLESLKGVDALLVQVQDAKSATVSVAQETVKKDTLALLLSQLSRTERNEASFQAIDKVTLPSVAIKQLTVNRQCLLALSTLFRSVSAISNDLEVLESEIAELSECKKTIMPGVCPLCGGTVCQHA